MRMPFDDVGLLTEDGWESVGGGFSGRAHIDDDGDVTRIEIEERNGKQMRFRDISEGSWLWVQLRTSIATNYASQIDEYVTNLKRANWDESERRRKSVGRF